MQQEEDKQEMIRSILNPLDEEFKKQHNEFRFEENYFAPPKKEYSDFIVLEARSKREQVSWQIVFVDHLEKLDFELLLGQKEIGVDVEFNKKKGYFGTVCLIQLAFGNQAIILDMLLIKFIDKLRAVFESEKIVKVFYGGSQDIIWLKQCLGIEVKKPVFDVKVAAECMAKGSDNSLISLWHSYCKVEFDREEKKKLQVSDWAQRPLSEQQLVYSALDAFYLPYLRRIILNRIMEKNGVDGIAHVYRSMAKKLVLSVEGGMVPISIPQTIRGCQKKLLELVGKMPQQQFLLQQKQLHFMIFLFLELAKVRNEFGFQQDLNAQCEVEDDDDLALFVVNYVKEINKRDVVDSGEFQKYFADTGIRSQYAQLFESEIKSQAKSMTWGDLKKLSVGVITDFVMSSRERVDFAINFSSIELECAQKETDAMAKKKEEKKQRFLKFQEKYSCKSEVYSNCKILSPDGVVISNCDEQKVKWYLKNNLVIGVEQQQIAIVQATLEQEDPKVIRLNFEPGGKGHSELQEELDQNELQFYSTERKNECVVCGSSQKYLKFHIVPMLYRRFFPNAFKSHRSHDILLLCLRCHEKASASIDKLKDQVTKLYNVPNVMESEQKVRMKKIDELKKMSENYQNKKATYPKEVRRKMKAKLKEQYKEVMEDAKIAEKIEFPKDLEVNKDGECKVGEKLLSFCKNLGDAKKMMKEKSNNEFKNLQGKLVVDQLKTEEDLKQFIKLWRKHFLDEMSPQFLPPAWNLDHKFTREFGKNSVYHND